MLRTIDESGWVMLVLWLLVIMFFFLWRQGIKNRIHLASLIALVLIDEQEFKHQQKALAQFLKASKARSRGLLLGQVTNGLTEISIKIAPSKIDKIKDDLWMINHENK